MKKRGTPKEAAGGLQLGEQVLWWCPACKGVRHRATYQGNDGRRFHCLDAFESKSDMFVMQKVRVTVELV